MKKDTPFTEDEIKWYDEYIKHHSGMEGVFRVGEDEVRGELFFFGDGVIVVKPSIGSLFFLTRGHGFVSTKTRLETE